MSPLKAFAQAKVACWTTTTMLHRFVPVTLLLSVDWTVAHSRLRQSINIDSKGFYVGSFGYSRGFVDIGARAQGNEWLVPRETSFLEPRDLLCHPAENTPNQSPGFPRLQSPPGGMVAMRYAEGGHVTIPNGGKGLTGKPEKGGTVFVFGTQQPDSDETLMNVLRWTRDGQGGDRRGVLLTAQNFDDGRCYELGDEKGNDSELAKSRRMQTPNSRLGQPDGASGLLCETDVKIPEDAPVNKPYTIYWVWQWGTAPGQPNAPNGKDEYYTSCMDIDVVPELPAVKSDHFLVQQDAMATAVSDFLSRTALTTDPWALSAQPGFGTSLTTAPTVMPKKRSPHGN